MRTLALPAVVVMILAPALPACAGQPKRPAATSPDAPTRVLAGPVASGPQGGYEAGRLTAPDQAVAGPFVLSYLAPGAELQLVSVASGAAVLGAVVGPLSQPFHVPAGASLRLPTPGDVVYAGYRPMPITRPLDAWVGQQILLGVAGAQPEPWLLRGIGGDHLTIERSRTYRVLPIRRISEIVWTDLTGIDPTPRVVLAPE